MRSWFLSLITLVVFAIITFKTNVFAASITGTVKFSGKVPQMKPIAMDADPQCAAKHKNPLVSQTLVLGAGNTIGNILVSVKSGAAKKTYTPKKEPYIVTQDGCWYSPRVIALVAGQPVKFLNPDGIFHNVNATPKMNKGFNMVMPGTITESDLKVFDKPEEAFGVKCDVHPWMGAFIRVFEHPFFAVTKEDGKYKIDGLEAGNYELEFWHEKMPAQVIKVMVKGNESVTQDITFSR